MLMIRGKDKLLLNKITQVSAIPVRTLCLWCDAEGSVTWWPDTRQGSLEGPTLSSSTGSCPASDGGYSVTTFVM